MRVDSFETFGLTAALLATTDPGTDDAARDGAIGRHTVGEDDGQGDPDGEAERDHAVLAVVLPRVVGLNIGTGEDQRGEGKVEPASGEVLVTLGGIPVERHWIELQRIYTRSSRPRRYSATVQLQRIQT